jgi:CHAD domain-containing protein
MKHDRKPNQHQATRPADAESHFSQYASRLVQTAISHAATLDSDPDAEALHKLRVALRRLRSLLWAYRPLLDRRLDDEQRALFKYLAGVAGQTRDWDILIELLDRPADTEALGRCLGAARAEAFDKSRETLANADIKSGLEQSLKESNHALNTSPRRTPLSPFARKRVAVAHKSLDKRMRRAAHAKKSDYASYHAVRKAGKKVRYLLEFFQPQLGKHEIKSLKGLKKLQKRFGSLNDVVASEALIRANRERFRADRSVDTALANLESERKRRLKAAARML